MKGVFMRQKLQTSAHSKYLSLFPLPKTVYCQIVHLIDHWLQCNGVEWTNQRLKSLFQWRVQSESDPQFTIPFIKVKSFRKGLPVLPESKKRPAGPFGYLWSIDLLTALRILRVYSVFVLKSVSKAQLNKFYGGLEHQLSPKQQKQVEFLISDLLPTIEDDKKFFSRWQFSKPNFELEMDKVTSSTRKRAPVILDDGNVITKYEDQTSIDENLRWVYQDGTFSRLFQEMLDKQIDLVASVGLQIPGLPPEIAQAMGLVPGYAEKPTWYKVLQLKPTKYGVLSGRISYIQEPGCKLRAVANPARPVQVMLEPMKKVLHSWLRQCPQDFTYDQEAGAARVAEWQRQGRTLTCYDLSDATSTFPWQITKSLLERVLDESWQPSIQLMDKMVQESWLTPEKKLTRFVTGQPLGLGPSFSAFAYSHHMMARIAKEMLRNILQVEVLQKNYSPEHAEACLKESDWVIVGDDIVLGSQELASLYSYLMQSIGCKISAQKSIVNSKRVAEFVGHLVVDGKAIKLPKWRNITNDNFLDLAKTFGPKIADIFPPHLSYVLRKISHLPEPLGLGWNPEGIPIEVRLDGWWDEYLSPHILPLPDDARESSLTRRELVALRNSVKQTEGCSPIVPQGDQPADPALILLKRLSDKFRFPINGNIEQIQKDRPELFTVMTTDVVDIYYHKSYWGRDVVHSSSADVNKNNQFLKARLQHGLQHRRVNSLFQWYKEILRRHDRKNG